ncbi:MULTISPECIES: hypothetical protein [Leptolyngbya]|uniref:hypothetical protein n=1 Tax=Leptolyngbya TaxID=47251 RepID=UPI001686FA80|nr:hypothetical protein [Leptolyngbya sp. FACHB-1624]MBD1857574.1 hypothetical protein [Leptolyngbya sp. FACHB-1624]
MGMPESAFQTLTEKFGKELSLVPEEQIFHYLQQAEFETPYLLFRSLMYGVWLTRVRQ